MIRGCALPKPLKECVMLAPTVCRCATPGPVKREVCATVRPLLGHSYEKGASKMPGTKKDKHQTSARFGGDVSRRRFLETMGGVGAAGGVLALTLSSLKAQAAEGPLKLGTMGPFTGPASRTGDEFKNGVAMAIEDAKAAGELPLVLDGKKRDIELVFIDSQSSPEKAVKAVTDAVTRRGVEFIVNGWHSSVAMAIIDSEVPLKIVHIGHLGESQYISEKINTDPTKYRGYFKGWPAPPVLAGLYGPPRRGVL